jgi:hypothetical protein
MPTVHHDGPYDFVFFSSDEGEPPHIHVKREHRIAKFWLTPVSLAKNRGFKEHEVNKIARLVVKDQERLFGGMACTLSYTSESAGCPIQ